MCHLISVSPGLPEPSKWHILEQDCKGMVIKQLLALNVSVCVCVYKYIYIYIYIYIYVFKI